MRITNELMIFFSFYIAGMLSGVFFDILRGIRKNSHPHDVIVYLQDILFWIIIGMIAIYTSWISSEGEIRIYMLIGMLLGSIIYFFTFGKFVYKLFDVLFRYILGVIDTTKSVFFKEEKNEAQTENI